MLVELFGVTGLREEVAKHRVECDKAIQAVLNIGNPAKLAEHLHWMVGFYTLGGHIAADASDAMRALQREAEGLEREVVFERCQEITKTYCTEMENCLALFEKDSSRC